MWQHVLCQEFGASCVEGDCRQSVTSAAVAQLQLAQIFPSFSLQLQTSNYGNGALNYFSNTNWKPAHTPSIELQWLQDTTPLQRSKVSEIREQTDGQVDRFSNSLRATSCASFHLSDDFAFSQAITTLVSEKVGGVAGRTLDNSWHLSRGFPRSCKKCLPSVNRVRTMLKILWDFKWHSSSHKSLIGI